MHTQATHTHTHTQQVADAVDAMAEDTVWFRLVSVNTRQAKAALMSKALATRHALQAWLQAQWHAGNVQQVAAFEAMIAAVNEEPASTEDMDALVKYAARVQEVSLRLRRGAVRGCRRASVPALCGADSAGGEHKPPCRLSRVTATHHATGPAGLPAAARGQRRHAGCAVRQPAQPA